MPRPGAAHPYTPHPCAAIDFFVSVDRIEGKAGEARVVITLNGKASAI